MHLLRTGRNVTIIALILSLLFHASTVFYVFLQKTRNDFFSKTETNNLDTMIHEQQQEQQKHTPWVETKARAGNFGAPVFFEDIADDITPQENDVSEKALAKSEALPCPPELSTEDGAKAEETPLQENITIVPQDSPKIEIPRHQKIEPIQTALATTPKIPTPKALPKKSPSKQNNQTNPFINYPTRENKQKPSLTLAQLTQGFLNQRKEESGSYGISMLGMKRGIPSDEQMKYERYLQKLSWCLQNSFNIHRDKQPLLSTDTDIYLYFQLNRDGILEQLHVKKSSGNKLLDNFVVFVFREASHSFPPVPTYLPDNPFRMGYAISIIKALY